MQATSGLLPWVQKPDSLLLPSGTTYRYTMDTPEGEGLVPTLFSVNELLECFAETNGVPCRLVDSPMGDRGEACGFTGTITFRPDTSDSECTGNTDA